MNTNNISVDSDITKIKKTGFIDTCSIFNILSSQLFAFKVFNANFQFHVTKTVVYETVEKKSKNLSIEEETLKLRFQDYKNKGKFEEHQLSLLDLTDVDALKKRKKVSMGELSSIVMAKNKSISFTTDDRGARKLSEIIIGKDRTQTASLILGYLIFNNDITDSEVPQIIKEHEAHKRPLRPYFEAVYQNAMMRRMMQNHS